MGKPGYEGRVDEHKAYKTVAQVIRDALLQRLGLANLPWAVSFHVTSKKSCFAHFYARALIATTAARFRAPRTRSADVRVKRKPADKRAGRAWAAHREAVHTPFS